MCRVYHTGKRIGLIRGRVFGVERALAPVIVYLDSHCECVTGWLEPLLQRIHEG
jgi:polypeptide N-acetylgalactosaminyltransferase